MPSHRILVLLSIVASILGLTGCATKTSQVAPGADLRSIERIHVVRLPADQRGINRVIADQLGVMGCKATTGDAGSAPTDAQALLTYQDKWMWDITMYMIELNVQLREPATEVALATARSYRPSLQRKSPPEMAKEVLAELLPRK